MMYFTSALPSHLGACWEAYFVWHSHLIIRWFSLMRLTVFVDRDIHRRKSTRAESRRNSLDRYVVSLDRYRMCVRVLKQFVCLYLVLGRYEVYRPEIIWDLRHCMLPLHGCMVTSEKKCMLVHCFIAQMEGADVDLGSKTGHNCNEVFLLCATNCPWELDPAFLRRFQRRIYIPLPDR